MVDELINIKDKIENSTKLDPESKYSKALKIIQDLKNDFGNCKCADEKVTSGLMSTRDYITIHFNRCTKCKAYSFRQDQIYYFIEKNLEKK